MAIKITITSADDSSEVYEFKGETIKEAVSECMLKIPFDAVGADWDDGVSNMLHTIAEAILSEVGRANSWDFSSPSSFFSVQIEEVADPTKITLTYQSVLPFEVRVRITKHHSGKWQISAEEADTNSGSSDGWYDLLEGFVWNPDAIIPTGNEDRPIFAKNDGGWLFSKSSEAVAIARLWSETLGVRFNGYSES